MFNAKWSNQTVKLIGTLVVIMTTWSSSQAKAAAKPIVTASNPPVNGTTKTIVNWSINSTSSSYTVYCRLDMSKAGGQAYAPIVCPKTGVPLGQSSPLPAGNYELDFYINSGSGINAALPDTKYNWSTVPTAPKLAVTASNPPSNGTTSTIVNWSINSTDTSLVVYCRLDMSQAGGLAYAPIVCPKTGVPLGQSSPLPAGNYELDFYINNGSGINAAMPDTKYNWSVVAAAPSPTPTPSPQPTVIPVPTGSSLSPFYSGLTSWGIDAPTDGDGTDYSEKEAYSYFKMGAVSSISQYPTVKYNGSVRFGPTVVDGLPALQLTVHQGEPLRHNGARSQLNYDGFRMSHGVDYWFAFAFKMGPEWTVANSGGRCDQQNIFDTHQDYISAMVTPFAISWESNDQKTPGSELVWRVGLMDGSSTPVVYKAASKAGVWTRIILHYRSGASYSNPIVESWIAYGTESFSYGNALKDNQEVPKTTPFGDPATYQHPDNWVVTQIYKWTHTCWGSATTRTIYNSGVFKGQGTNLFNDAVNAVAPYAK